MRIGVLSDTHDRLPVIDAAVRLFVQRGVDAIIHAGDYVAPFAAKRLLAFPGPLYAVFGNNDGERRMLKETLPQLVDGPLFVELGGRRVLVHHFVEWCTPEAIAEADIVVTGHTHEPGFETRGGTFYLNPGECCGWLSERCTVAVLDTDGPSAEIVELEAK